MEYSLPGTRKNMDFIERTFGIAPDGGSGALEVLLLVILAAGLATAYAWRRRSRDR